MIFCGDTVFPLNYKDNIIDVIDYKFLQKEKIVNLESLIDLGPMNKLSSTIGLYSTQDLTFFLKELNVVSCSQANNHITDFNTSINKQKKFLKSHGIDSFGAGDNIDVANTFNVKNNFTINIKTIK